MTMYSKINFLSEMDSYEENELVEKILNTSQETVTEMIKNVLCRVDDSYGIEDFPSTKIVSDVHFRSVIRNATIYNIIFDDYESSTELIFEIKTDSDYSTDLIRNRWKALTDYNSYSLGSALEENDPNDTINDITEQLRMYVYCKILNNLQSEKEFEHEKYMKEIESMY